ncbi:hypothetical protein B0O99DRAFT_590228 [Bisporella sp. PMI_857]|nr:hypothetical protein B0O99DRAFT_590656 [Bisporella sp. PMI_857]KAH8600576.1 hypothetical protein B0O99DRAFT_590228 [Bisporella sp. PMI_857]
MDSPIYLYEVAGWYSKFPNLQFELLDNLEGFEHPFESMESLETISSHTIKRQAHTTSEETTVLSDIADYSNNVSTAGATRRILSTDLLLLSLRHCVSSDTVKLQTLPMASPRVPRRIVYQRPEMATRNLARLSLPNLKVLKMRKLCLRSQVLAGILLQHPGLYSLDVRENLLNDDCLPAFGPLLQTRSWRNQPSDGQHEAQIFESPPEFARYDPAGYTEFEASQIREIVPKFVRPDGKEAFQQYCLEHGQILTENGRICINQEDPLMSDTKLTQLYLSGNLFSVAGIIKIMKYSGNLQVIDIGATIHEKHIMPCSHTPRDILMLPSINELLAPKFSTFLTELRVHHYVVTSIPTFVFSNRSGFDLDALEEAENLGRDLKAVHQHRSDVLLTNHQIKRLILTHIPTKSYGLMIEELKTFLRACRAQERLILAAAAEQTSNRRAPKLLSGLKFLRLELLYSAKPPPDHTSISGDADADVFQAQLANDTFSFFTDASGPPDSTSHLPAAVGYPVDQDDIAYPREQNHAFNATYERSRERDRGRLMSTLRLRSTSATRYSSSLGTSPIERPNIPPSSTLGAALRLDSKLASVEGDNAKKETMGKRELFDVVTELKQFRAECADDKWTGIINLTYSGCM